MTTTWHVNLSAEGFRESSVGSSGAPEGHLLVSKASKRVWEELYALKKPVSLYT